MTVLAASGPAQLVTRSGTAHLHLPARRVCPAHLAGGAVPFRDLGN